MTRAENVLHSPIKATARIVQPYLYEVLWRLALEGPLLAAEIAADHNRSSSTRHYARWTPSDAANKLRGPVRLGLVERDKDGFWMLTRAGRTWMTTGIDCDPT